MSDVIFDKFFFFVEKSEIIKVMKQESCIKKSATLLQSRDEIFHPFWKHCSGTPVNTTICVILHSLLWDYVFDPLPHVSREGDAIWLITNTGISQ